MNRTQSTYFLFLTIAAALLLASNQIGRPEGWSMVGVYGYWTGRILIEAALFVAFADLLSRLLVLKPRPALTCALAALVSLFPFVLSITTLDLILGLPELEGTIGLAAASSQATQAGATRIGSFLRELIYLSDNHLALCLLLSAPRLVPLLAGTEEQPATGQTSSIGASGTTETVETKPVEALEDHIPSNEDKKGFQRHLERPLEGPLQRVEAQEHYIRLVSQSETQMVLYRFNDIVAELPSDLGMQVHRSHWVAFEAVKSLSRDAGRLFLVLNDGSQIPVSRKYADPVRSHFSEDAANTKRAVS